MPRQVLENRLDKSLLKFNEALAHNKQLRESIDSLRRERQSFDSIYKKLDKDLTEKKNEMQRIIDLSNAAYCPGSQSFFNRLSLPPPALHPTMCLPLLPILPLLLLPLLLMLWLHADTRCATKHSRKWPC